jgi:tetratricopeptide (TPR) repeat protein
MIDAIIGTSIMGDDRAALLANAEATLIKVLSIAPNHAFAHMLLGATLTATNRAAQGIAECERALALDRNLAEAHAQIGFAQYCIGHGAETEVHVNRALQLSPRDVFVHRWLFYIGAAKFQLNKDAEAVGWLLRSVEANRNYPPAYFWLAAVLAALGSLDRARAAARAGLAINPRFTVSRFRNAPFSDDPSYLAKRERVYEGMRLAGVPEG